MMPDVLFRRGSLEHGTMNRVSREVWLLWHESRDRSISLSQHASLLLPCRYMYFHLQQRLVPTSLCDFMNANVSPGRPGVTYRLKYTIRMQRDQERLITNVTELAKQHTLLLMIESQRRIHREPTRLYPSCLPPAPFSPFHHHTRHDPTT